MLTEPTIMIEQKGVDATPWKNRHSTFPRRGGAKRKRRFKGPSYRGTNGKV
jgi:hypothetical protein